MAGGHFATIGGNAVFIPGGTPKGFDIGGVPSGLKTAGKVAAGVGLGALAASGRGRGLAKHLSKRMGSSGAIKRLRPGSAIKPPIRGNLRNKIKANVSRSEAARAPSGFNLHTVKETALKTANKPVSGGLSTVSRKGASSRAFVRKEQASALKTLGLKPGATPKDAKKQFFALSKKMHPDAVGHSKFESQFQNISKAYNTIRTSGRNFSQFAKA